MRSFEIIVIQSGFALEDYLSTEMFAKKVENLFASAFTNVSGAKNNSAGTIVVFPELTGLWLPVFMLALMGDSKKHAYIKFNPDNLINTLSLGEVVKRIIFAHPFEFFISLLGGKSFSFVFRKVWIEAFRAWIGPFRESARKYGVYVCPGSSFIPYIDYDVVMGFSVKGKNVYNTSCLINDEGKILGFTRKVNLTRDELRLGIKPGDNSEFRVYNTRLGKLGILICLDGFYTGAVETMDREGCEVIIQPSANPVGWRKPPRKGTLVSQEEEWLGKGLGSLIQGRENILISVNPMSVSSVLGHRDEGRSNVFVNLREAERRGFSIEVDSKWLPTGQLSVNGKSLDKYKGLSVVASGYDREEIIKFKGVFADGR